MLHNRTPARVLVVDDDRSILDLVVTRLQIAGYRTAFARDGAAALDAVRVAAPHAMVLDLNMPGIDGFDVLRRLKELGLPTPPTLVLTARNAPRDVSEIIRLGARDYLTKPFRDQDLLARVARLLRHRPAPVVENRLPDEPWDDFAVD